MLVVRALAGISRSAQWDSRSEPRPRWPRSRLMRLGRAYGKKTALGPIGADTQGNQAHEPSLMRLTTSNIGQPTPHEILTCLTARYFGVQRPLIQRGADRRLAPVTSAKRVFLAATGQNRGKTTTSLGLSAAIRERGLRLGFMKPVGQRYLVVDGTRADEDAV